MRCEVHRVDRRAKRQFFLQDGLSGIGHRRHRQAKLFGRVTDDNAGPTADGDHAQAVADRVDSPGRGIRHVQQLGAAVGADHGVVAEHCVEYFVIARQ